MSTAWRRHHTVLFVAFLKVYQAIMVMLRLMMTMMMIRNGDDSDDNDVDDDDDARGVGVTDLGHLEFS